MSNTDHTTIETEKQQVFEGENFVKLIEPCCVNKGILRLTPEEKSHFQKKSNQLDGKKAFFIPASGSGSRMFAFLFDFLKSGESTVETRTFFEHFWDLAISKDIDRDFLQDRSLENRKKLVHHLLDETSLNLSKLPKGLIPFHNYQDKVRTAFEEQVAQIVLFDLGVEEIHFTVQEEYVDSIEQKIRPLLNGLSLSFSNQLKESNAFCFTENGELATENGDPIRRPAGHGALLTNLNEVDADVLLIKNIDNVQHESKSEKTKVMWEELLGVLADFEEKLSKLNEQSNQEEINLLCDNFGLRYGNEEFSLDQLKNRPTRICGMVKNEGEPGGGPFWIEKNDGSVSKEIVEKAQISPEQKKIMEESSHFNPVLIVASKKNPSGGRFNLLDYSDDSNCIVVSKDHNGQKIKYRELPGLWNGAMSNWNTIFVEVSSKTFSPVKHMLNLFDEAHQG